MNDRATFNYGKADPSKGFGVTINGASEALWKEVSAVMGNQRIDSDDYRMKKDTGAFFQGGSSGGDWIFLEFWSEHDKHPEFVKYLRDIFFKYHPDGLVSGIDLLPEDKSVRSVKKAIVIFRKAPWHQAEVITSIHEVCHEIARVEEALNSHAAQVMEEVQVEFVKKFCEFKTATWRYEIHDLQESSL